MVITGASHVPNRGSSPRIGIFVRLLASYLAVVHLLLLLAADFGPPALASLALVFSRGPRHLGINQHGVLDINGSAFLGASRHGLAPSRDDVLMLPFFWLAVVPRNYEPAFISGAEEK